MDRLAEERIAENDSRFRDANERIRDAAEGYDITTLVPFICECAEPTCVEIVRLDLDDYRSVRRNARWFVNAPGHQRVAGSAVKVVSGGDGYVVVEKLGHAGEVAERLAGESEALAAERDAAE